MSSFISRVRGTIWPVEKREWTVVVVMMLLKFFITCNYGILTSFKDAIITTPSGSGTEIIHFVKAYASFPSIILFTILYVKLNSIMSFHRVFDLVIFLMIFLFIIFYLVIFPNHESFHMSAEQITELRKMHPHFQWFVPLVGYWAFVLFYILAELWSTMCVTIIFWSLANDITPVDKASKFYPLFILAGNVGVMFAYYVIKCITASSEQMLCSSTAKWHNTINMAMPVIILVGFLVILLHRYLQYHIKTEVSDLFFMDKKKKTEAKKKSFFRDIKLIFKSKYLGFIALMVFSFNVAINILEVTWKEYVRIANPEFNDFASMMASNVFFIASTSAIMIIFGGQKILRSSSWLNGAIVTPAIVFIMGNIFCAMVVFDYYTGGSSQISSLAQIIAYVGMVQVVAIKAAKYAFFDTSKESAFIPLDSSLRNSGKAAVDSVASRTGKTSSSFMQQLLLIMSATSTQMSISPFLWVVLLMIVTLWIWATIRVSTSFKIMKGREVQGSHEALQS